MPSANLRTWALKGAEQRLLEISEEAAAIYASFPELRDRGGMGGQIRRGPGRPRNGETASSEAGTPRRRRRKRTMSADARRRISEAQKARWAKQKGEAAAAAPAATGGGSRQSSSKKK